jgi:PE-PPE domain
MRARIRSIVVAILALLACALIGLASTITSALTLAATALIVPGTGTPNPNVITGYEPNAVNYYIAPTTVSCQVTCSTVGIPYIAQFWPFPFAGWGGLSGAKWNVSVASGVTSLNSALINELSNNPTGDVVIFGYSQGATVAGIEKSTLANVANKSQYSFVLIGNPQRPNGGIFERFAFLGTVPILDATFGNPTPTNTGIATTDIAFQYDGVSDFPEYPIDVLADLNAIAGFAYIHGTYLTPNSNAPDELPDGYTPAELQAAINNPANRQTYGDTTYITIPTTTLPLLQPLIQLGTATGTTALVTPIVDLISPALRVLIDLGYNPNANPGIPTPFQLIPPVNPLALASNLITAGEQGVQAALGDLGTTPPVPLTTPTTPTPITLSPLAASTLKTPLATTPKVTTPTVTTPTVTTPTVTTPTVTTPTVTTPLVSKLPASTNSDPTSATKPAPPKFLSVVGSDLHHLFAAFSDPTTHQAATAANSGTTPSSKHVH